MVPRPVKKTRILRAIKFVPKINRHRAIKSGKPKGYWVWGG